MQQELADSGGWLVKLVDFGLGTGYDPDGFRHTAVGSPGYFSPEIAQGATYVGPEVDVWSMGVVLYEMTTGMHPFSAKELAQLKEVVIRGEYAIPHHISQSLRNTFRKLLSKAKEERRSLHILDRDEWINNQYRDSPVYTAMLSNDEGGPTSSGDKECADLIDSGPTKSLFVSSVARGRKNTEGSLGCFKEGPFTDISDAPPVLMEGTVFCIPEEDEDGMPCAPSAEDASIPTELVEKLKRFNTSMPSNLHVVVESTRQRQQTDEALCNPKSSEASKSGMTGYGPLARKEILLQDSSWNASRSDAIDVPNSNASSRAAFASVPPTPPSQEPPGSMALRMRKSKCAVGDDSRWNWTRWFWSTPTQSTSSSPLPSTEESCSQSGKPVCSTTSESQVISMEPSKKKGWFSRLLFAILGGDATGCKPRSRR
jgi:serine/threonine protein kinase